MAISSSSDETFVVVVMNFKLDKRDTKPQQNLRIQCKKHCGEWCNSSSCSYIFFCRSPNGWKGVGT